MNEPEAKPRWWRIEVEPRLERIRVLEAELAAAYEAHRQDAEATGKFVFKLRDERDALKDILKGRDIALGILKARVAELERRAPPEALWDIQDDLAGKEAD